MKRTTVLEFFPELERYVPQHTPVQAMTMQEGRHKQKLLIFPSPDSLRVYTSARFQKRRLMWTKVTRHDTQEGTNVVMLKRYTNLKSYRLGKSRGIRSTPALVLDRKFIIEGPIPIKRELEAVVDEIMADE